MGGEGRGRGGEGKGRGRRGRPHCCRVINAAEKLLNVALSLVTHLMFIRMRGITGEWREVTEHDP